jgi:hypothetical protein
VGEAVQGLLVFVVIVCVWVDEKNKLLGRRAIDFSTGEGGRVKWVRVGMRR